MISRLKEIRLKRHMTQEELSKSSKVSLNQIQKYETDIGYLYRCNVTTAKKLAKVLRCQPEDLLPYEDIIEYERMLEEQQSPKE